jgi:Tfp pilus assembly protein PilX
MNQRGFVLMVALIIMSVMSLMTLFQLEMIDQDISFLRYLIDSRLTS